jgi:hypothetical protein
MLSTLPTSSRGADRPQAAALWAKPRVPHRLTSRNAASRGPVRIAFYILNRALDESLMIPRFFCPGHRKMSGRASLVCCIQLMSPRAPKMACNPDLRRTRHVEQLVPGMRRPSPEGFRQTCNVEGAS